MMSSPLRIQICHSNPALVAEVKVWAASAGYPLDTLPAGAAGPARDVALTIVELTGRGNAEIELMKARTQEAGGRVVVLAAGEPDELASLRLLFQAGSFDAIVLARDDFRAAQLANLLGDAPKDEAFTPEALAAAIRDRRVVVHYQPKVPFRAGAGGYGVEALCRIQAPGGGLVFPDAFIPLAEANNLIHELTDAVTIQAFTDLAGWDTKGPAVKLALNISPSLMADRRWADLFESRCAQFNVDPTRIILEVTESSPNGTKAMALEILSRLRLKGFLLSIDDFGTGFSSLETLYKLPFGELKLDKGFVLDLLHSQEARTLVESTVSLARKLGLRITAEGVETRELFEALRLLQCDDAQGYFISKPITANQIIPFFHHWSLDNPTQHETVGSQLRVIQGLLADILAPAEDEDDATIVLGSGRAPQSSQDVAAKIPALLLSGDRVGCLEHVHRALKLQTGPGDLTSKLQTLRAELERTMLTNGIVFRAPDHETQVIGGCELTLGRESASSAADIAIPCRWLSRGAKNLKVFHAGGEWRLTDLGSTNGHFLNGKRLVTGDAIILPPGATRIEVGKVDGRPAPAWLEFLRIEKGALEITYDALEATDIKRRWLVFTGEISLRAQPLGGGPTACADGDADLVMREGLWIVPKPGSTIVVNDREFASALPLVAGATIHTGAMSLHTAAEFSTSCPEAQQATA